MKTGKTLSLLTLLLPLASCSLFKGPGSDIGWTDAIPPVGNGVGRLVETNHGFKSLSTVAFQVTPDQLETLDTYNYVSDEEDSKYKIGAEAAFNQITANASVERSTTNLSHSSEWRIIQLKDFSTAAINKEFAYRCLTAKEYSYEVATKTSSTLKAETPTIAKAFGVPVGAIEISAKPDNPDQSKVTIADPNVCLSFISATLVRDRPWWSRYDGTRSIKLDGKTSFNLKTDESGPIVEPDFGKRAVETKPRYRLYASEAGGKPILKIFIEDREMHQEIPSKILKETYTDVWEQSYLVHSYHIENNIYAIMSIDIKARRTANNEIEVTKAELSSPEYKLIRN
jgi:hypothetical protein